MEPPEASWNDWSTSKFTVCRFLDTWDPYPHLIEQLSRKKPTRCNVPRLVPIMLYLLTFFVLDLYAALVLTDVGFASLASLPVSEQPPILAHSSMAQPKFVQLVTTTVPLFMLPLPEWEEQFLKTSIAKSTTEACGYVHQMDSADRIADSPSDKKQKAATTLLHDAMQIRDFAVPIAARASRILGPISRHLMEQIIPMICNAARASRPGFAVFVCYIMACASQNDSLTMKNKLAGWDAPMSQIVFPDTTSALSSLTSSLLFGETLESTFEKINCFTTSSLKPF